MFALDIATLAVAHCATALVASAALFGAHRLLVDMRGPRWWSSGALTGALGVLLLASRGMIADPVSEVVAHAALILAYIFLTQGFRDYLGVRRLPLAIVVIWPTAAAACLLLYSVAVPSLTARLLILTISLCVASALMTHDLLRHGDRGERATRLVGWLMGLNAVVFAIRVTAVATIQPKGDLLHAGAGTSAVYLYHTAFSTALFLGMVLMIGERLYHRTQRQALEDPLTGVENRRGFYRFVSLDLHEPTRGGAPAALLAIDLDSFKQINDHHGHAVGDRLLQHFVTVVRGQIRHGDLLSRFGGEEFVLMLPATERAVAMKIAERIRSAVAATPLPADGEAIGYTVSIGVARVEPHEGNETAIDLAIARADAALYRAKSLGRNRVEESRGPTPDLVSEHTRNCRSGTGSTTRTTK